MGNLFKSVERVKKEQSDVALKHLMINWGTPMLILKPVKNATSRVYGTESGEVSGKPVKIIGLITSDDFFPTGPTQAGTFTEGWLYTESTEVDVGDKLRIEGDAGRVRDYEVTERHSLGQTTNVFQRWKLSSIMGTTSGELE